VTAWTDEDAVRVAVAAVRCYREHPEWEDIQQEAILGAIVQSRRVAESGQCSPSTAAHNAARWAVRAYLYPHRGSKKDLAFVSLEGMVEESDHRAADAISLDWGQIDTRVTLLTAARRICTPCQVSAIETLLRGLPHEMAAERLGINRPAFSERCAEARKALRAAFPEGWE
jgi:DNA-directed RNA polymerase specialized sigma24 family protein